jgi:hypothetical protein
VEQPTERTPVARLGRSHVGAVRLDPGSERHVVRGKRLDEQRQLVRRRRHVSVGEGDQVGRSVQHPRADRRTLAAVRDAKQAQPRAVRSDPGRLRSGGDDRCRVVRAAVVDDEDVDRGGEPIGARCALSGHVATPREIAEQLVERWSDAIRLVVGRQDDGQARLG